MHKINQKELSAKYIHNDVLKLLCSYPWPGNVRQLKYEIETAYYQSGQNEAINVTDLSDDMRFNSLQIVNNDESNINGKLTHIHYKLIEKGESFWDVVHKPYRKGDLNRAEVRYIINRGLEVTNNLKGLQQLYQLSNDDYRKFYLFIYRTIFKGQL